MPRLPTRLDPYRALAEPKRRQVLDALAEGERPVNALVESLGWPQPMVSKHLSVLRRAGLVRERRAGRHRIYTLNAAQLRPVHEWLARFERLWTRQLERIKARAESLARERQRPT